MKIIIAIIILIVAAITVILYKAWDLAGFIVQEFEQRKGDGKEKDA